MPTSNFQPIRLFDPGCWYNFTYSMTNSADPDQLASSEANWSCSTLFAKGRAYLGSVGQGLRKMQMNVFFLLFLSWKPMLWVLIWLSENQRLIWNNSRRQECQKKKQQKNKTNKNKQTRKTLDLLCLKCGLLGQISRIPKAKSTFASSNSHAV